MTTYLIIHFSFHSCGRLRGGVGICYVNTFLVKVEAFPGGTPLTIVSFWRIAHDRKLPHMSCVFLSKQRCTVMDVGIHSKFPG